MFSRSGDTRTDTESHRIIGGLFVLCICVNLRSSADQSFFFLMFRFLPDALYEETGFLEHRGFSAYPAVSVSRIRRITGSVSLEVAKKTAR